MKRIFAIVLAAGESSRFGSSKQLAYIGDKTLVQHAVSVATGVCAERTLVIAGAEWQAVTKSAVVQCPFFAINERFSEGIGGSIALATRLLASRADAILIVLADQVLVTSEHLQHVLEAWSGDEKEIVASAYAHTSGPPVLFPKGAFANLMRLSGDQGAHSLLCDEQFHCVAVPFEDAAVDIDTRDDLATLRRR